MKNRDKSNIALYNDTYSQQKELLRYPDEVLVSYLFTTLRPDISVKNILVTGFGAGRHVALFADHGYAVSGIEPSEFAVAEAKKRAAEKGHKVDLRVGACSQLPFEDGAFDVVLCWGVINNVVEKDELDRSMNEMRRVLRMGGRLLISLMAPQDFKYREALHINDNLYKILYNNHEYYTRFWNRQQSIEFVESYGYQIEKIGFVLRNVNFDEKVPIAYYTIAANKIIN